MKRTLVALALLLAPSVGRAGHIYVPAELARFGSADTDCSKVSISTAFTEYTVVRCLDTPATYDVSFYLHVSFPGDAGNSWAYSIEYETVDPTTTDTCQWQVGAMVFKSDADANVDTGATGTDFVSMAGTNTYGASNKRHLTESTIPTAVYNVADSAVCSGTTCRDRDVRLKVQLIRSGTPGTTAESCDFRKLHITY